jgi:hypothetical protein
MHPLNEQLFNILKHTRIEIEPGRPLDIRLILEELKDRYLLTDSEVNGLMEGLV